MGAIRSAAIAVTLALMTAPAHASALFGTASIDVYHPTATAVRFCASASIDEPGSSFAEAVFLVVGDANPPVVEHDTPFDVYVGPSCIDVDTAGIPAGSVHASITIVAYGTGKIGARCEFVIGWAPGLPPHILNGACSS